MVLARDSVFRSGYFSGFFFLLLLFSLLYRTVFLEELACFLFVLFFESRLIPTLFLILIWGYQPERVQAGICLLFYTLLASLPLLVGILFIIL
jgi:NADH-ubiquinone oxidoreductase chain 4